MKPKIYNARMLQVMDFWMEKNGKSITEFCEAIGFERGNIPHIRSGRQSFQHEHIQSAMKLIGGGNFNYIYGVESSMFRSEKKSITPIQQLDQAVRAIKEIYGK